MVELIVSLIAAVTSAIAIILSVFNIFLEKRRLLTETITSNRKEWIIEVRSILITFLTTYRQQPNNTELLESIIMQLEIYLNRKNSLYNEVINAARICIAKQVYSELHASNLINASQEMLSSTWTRMKREAGIKAIDEFKLVEELNQEFPSLIIK